VIISADQINDDTLLAFVDGQLDAENYNMVARYLEANPDKAMLVEQWQRQSGAIRALYNHAADEPVPQRLKPETIAIHHRHANSNFWRAAVAAIVLLAIGASVGWYGRDRALTAQSTSQTLITAAFKAHTLFTGQRLHPVEVFAGESSHLAAWLSNNLDRRLIVPQTLPNGFELVGGRLLPSGNSAAAQLMYETETGRRITIYLTPRTGDDPGEDLFVSNGNLDALYWANDQVTSTIVGDISRAEMEEIATRVFEILSGQASDYQFS
jgi:anti-sigma factor RsiW